MTELFDNQFFHIMLSMAGHPMFAFHRLKLWLFFKAFFDRIRTTGVESASLRWIDRTGNISAQHNTPMLLIDLRNRDGGQKRMGIGVDGTCEENLGFGYLHDLAQIHYSHPIADVFYYQQMVGYKHIG